MKNESHGEFRRRDRLEPGQKFVPDPYRPVCGQASPRLGLIDWLLACPEKGFFVPIASESTDTLCPTICGRNSRA
jgi:hypothetical protein